MHLPYKPATPHVCKNLHPQKHLPKNIYRNLLRQTLETTPTSTTGKANYVHMIQYYWAVRLNKQLITQQHGWACETCAKSDKRHCTLPFIWCSRIGPTNPQWKKTPKMKEEGVQPEKKTGNLFGVIKILYILIGVGITRYIYLSTVFKLFV